MKGAIVVLLNFIGLISYIHGFAQINPDSLRRNIKPLPAAEDLDCLYGCLECKTANRAFKTDSNLNSFFFEIDKNRSLRIESFDTLRFLRELLLNSYQKKSIACFLPFLRVFDIEADSIYGKTCYEGPLRYSYPAYCYELEIRYLVLFYIYFNYFEILKLESETHFSDVSLVYKGVRKELNDEDFEQIVAFYISALEKRYGADKGSIENIFEKFEYKWVVKFSN